MTKPTTYPFEVRSLAEEDGGGYPISFPDFAECISDGETVEDALASGQDALKHFIAHMFFSRCESMTYDVFYEML